MSDLYVRVYLDLLYHPKLSGAPAPAKWLYVAGFIVAFRERSDGHIRPPVACAEADVPAAHARTLIGREVWHPPGHSCARCPQPAAGQVYIHDYLDRQESKADLEAAKKKKSDAGKKGAAARWHSDSHGTRHSKRHDNSIAESESDEDPLLVTAVGQSRFATRAIDGLTDRDLETIRRRLGSTEMHAANVGIQILSRSSVEVLNPLRYVLAAIDNDPDDYKPTMGPPTTADACPVSGHGSYPARNCGACRADAIAGDA